MRRGEVWLINLDPTVGAEIRKTKPAAIVSDDAIGILPLKVIVPITEWKDRYAVAPLTIEVNHDLLSTPQNAPNLPMLEMKEFFDSAAGEKIGQDRVIWFDIDEHSTDQFKIFVQSMEDLFRTLRPQECGWEFLEVALDYFMKALRSSGLERLLWNITVVESLLGENRERLRDLLARRLGTVLGRTKRDQSDIRK